MEALENRTSKIDGQRKRRRAVSAAELYEVLETLLPSARVEIDCLAGYVTDFPEDPEHAEDAERVRRGQAALDMADRLIARKSNVIRRQQRVLKERQGQADA